MIEWLKNDENQIGLLIVTAIGVLVTAIELGILIYQTVINRKKERCDLTVKLLLDWSLNLNSNMTRSRKIVENFSKEQCKKLFNNEVFSVSPTQYKEICNRLIQGKTKMKAIESEKMVKLSPCEVNTLRDDVIKYLNLLESILAARQFKIADNKLIKTEFKYLVKSKSGECVLSVFREAMNDIESYPAIKKFCEDMNKESKRSD